MRLNNVDLEKIQNFEDQIKNDPSTAKKTQVIKGEWIASDSEVQFQSSIEFEGGTTLLKVDNPTFMGGGGNFPGPMHYCFFGLASCYMGTFATMAAMLGIKIKSLTTRVEADINFSRVFGVSEEPTIDEVRVIINIQSDAPEDKIKEAEKLALERCPVVFTLRNPVKLVPKLEIS
ncbi:MAG: OsmC family protein [Melioribacteraceae bacterium]|nr:OsmC family protein [Melioribacteraceae bacterium]MCF8356469.1 OsmC family protein [Melioribacteraceae bacterium]MCF8393381.1 OsmC family protein [Melioribacteraceae bacterium]MCF8418946.1 OsmC family protein [Melioribacteraceae bacterium]